MKKKTLIIIGVITLGFLGIVAGLFYFINRSHDSSQPGDSSVKTIPIAQTPDYKACQLLTKPLIGAAFTTLVTNVVDGERSGVIAPNDEPADACTYQLGGLSDENYELTVRVYPYSVSVEGKATKDPIDEKWSLMSEAKTPSYFRVGESSSGKEFIMRTIHAGKNYVITFAQTKDASIISDSELYVYMLSLSNGTSFTQEENRPDGLPPMPDYKD